ncbi:conserved hypothetical protein [Paecilomyces variotii No. 5]|uniref:Xylanolytic transcriptional activator regulatory domain-containing protein n=1 Tax=Byssochlamys spectabilis (strain No. 5 / NBRC 109023) TaxID=1356009 RepID=V5FXX9_BYSSN|nr:conserved hypothetical protein [Paecilomyces variotii No. 5]
MQLSASPSHSALDNGFDYPQESILTKTLGLEKSRFSELIGPGGEHDWQLLRQFYSHDYTQKAAESGNAPGPKARGSAGARKVHEYAFFQMTPDAVISQSSGKEINNEINVEDVERLVHPHGPTLIKLYFRIVHPSFPILHKGVFIEKYNRTYHEITPHLLAAVYALAIRWWSYDPDLLLLEKLNEAALVKIAHRAVQDAMHRPRLNTIQAGLLLLQRQRNPLSTDNSWMWSFTSSLIGLGQHLGLHLNCSDWNIPEWEKGLRKRLAWALFIQDTFSALILGRPCIISDTDWIVEPLQPRDFSEGFRDEEYSDQIASVSIENGKILFIELVKLARITARMLRQLYSLRSLAEVAEPQQVLAIAKPLGNDLSTLLKSLPDDLRMDNLQPGKLCVNGFLHLALHATTAALHRRLLWSMRRSSVDMDTQFVQFVREMLQTRARGLVQFVSHLRPEHMEAFWFFAAGGCGTILGSFLGLLRVTSVTTEESHEVQALMTEFEWQLRMKAKMGEWVSYTLTRLRALGWDRWKMSGPNLMANVVSSSRTNESDNEQFNQTVDGNMSPLFPYEEVSDTPTDLSNIMTSKLDGLDAFSCDSPKYT